MKRPASTTSDVEFLQASCRYPGAERPAVDSLDLHVEHGELMVLVGPSGSGKSTALRMLAGLEEVEAGEIHIGGVDVTDMPPRERDVAMVFQSYALYPHMSVAENMGFSLKMAGVARPERARRVAEAAAMLDLEPYLTRKPAQLSGGQRQRVAMGRAIVREPKVFLMDEPLSNLDAKLRVQTRSQIATLQRRLAVTTVYVTHDQVEAMTLGDRVAVLRDGELQQVDRPRVLYDRPDNVFVAGFIGSPAMNILPTQLQADGTVALGDHVVPLRREVVTAAAGAGCSSILLGVRPEGMRLSANGGLGASVTVVESLGSDTFLHCEAVIGDEARAVVVRAEATSPAEPGDVVHLQVKPEDVHVFDPVSGLRLGS
jgi:multiple sugar transport system ATP-binding protein